MVVWYSQLFKNFLQFVVTHIVKGFGTVNKTYVVIFFVSLLCLRGIRWRGKWGGGTGWGTHVNPWLIQVNV